MRAAIYTRVSTSNQAEKGYGLDVQLAKCKNMCEQKGYNIVKTYSDGGVSGTVAPTQRKEFSKLLEDAKESKFDILVFYCFDRLARELRIFLEIVDELRKLEIKIVSCKEDIDTSTDTGDFMLNIYGSIANLELRTIKTRLTSGKNQKRLINGYVGGKLPFGYKAVNKEVIIDDSKIDLIKEIFTCYDKLDMSFHKIAKYLNDSNLPTPSGKGKWHAKTVSRIIDNKEKYQGSIMNENENGVRWPRIL